MHKTTKNVCCCLYIKKEKTEKTYFCFLLLYICCLVLFALLALTYTDSTVLMIDWYSKMSTFETSLDMNWKSSSSCLEKQTKLCGHHCFPSSTRDCCACMDLRPILPENNYPCYEDGEGWTNTAPRDAGYCPVCNPKNFEMWRTIIQQTRAKNEAKKIQLQAEQEKNELIAEEDKRRAAHVIILIDYILILYVYSILFLL
jgi:hypothetical protein